MSNSQTPPDVPSPDVTPSEATSPEVMPPTLFSVLWPVGLLTVAIVSIQLGASFAKSLFGQIPPESITFLRIGFSACMMSVVFRLWRRKIMPNAWRPILVYGVSLGLMNLFFYLSIARIPVGIAVALEFLGPLCLVLFYTRTWIDGIWVFLAIIGLYLLSPLNAISSDLDTLGIVYALIAAVFWAVYIIYGQRASMTQGASAAAFGSIIAALCVLPFALYSSGSALFDPSILPLAFMVAFFASAIPYSIEMIVLARMSQRTFGILMSLEPAVAALLGFLILSEHLVYMQWVALFAISFASLGSTLTQVRARK